MLLNRAALVDIIWYEWRYALAKARTIGQSKRIATYLSNAGPHSLQIGTGPYPRPGWLNSDIDPGRGTIFLDATKRFPFPDESFDYVYSEHMIEHITYEAGLRMLAECFRVMKPRGTIRIATPDLAAIVAVYNPTSEAQHKYIKFATETFLDPVIGYSPALVINNSMRNWGHQFIYDAPSLEKSLVRAGFVNVRPAEIGSSQDAHLRDLESHSQTIENDEYNSYETFILEADKGA